MVFAACGLAWLALSRKRPVSTFRIFLQPIRISFIVQGGMDAAPARAVAAGVFSLWMQRFLLHYSLPPPRGTRFGLPLSEDLMSNPIPSLRPGARRTVLALTLVLLGAGTSPGAEERRVAVGKLTTSSATLVARPAPDKPWQVLKQGDEVFTADTLVGVDASVELKKGTVRLSLLSDLDDDSPFPIHETGVILHANPDVDLDVTLERGRVDVTNVKDKGPARVRVRFHNQDWDLTLAEPGTRVALELFGRWPRGSRFRKDAKATDGPTLDLVMLTLKGQVDRKCPTCLLALKAPPGPAYLHWDSVKGMDPSPKHLDKLPAWAAQGTSATAQAKERKAAVERLRKALTEKPAGDVLDAFVKSKDAADRRLAVFAMAALDDLERLAPAMLQAKHADVWENGVLAFRHWLGRGPGQDRKLYDFFLGKRDMTANQAQATIQLLHGFSDEDLAHPEAYELLIEYLRHDRQGIRQLAIWHLQRLVPAGKDIAYNPIGSKEEIQRGYKAWKELVPDGQMPPKPKEK